MAGVGIIAAAWILAKRAEASAVRLTPEQARALVTEINARDFGGWFSVPDVLAVIDIESAFDPWAYREEAHLGDASIGLMQILTSTARDRGYTGDPKGLFDPVTNIRLGMAQLKWSHDYLAARLGSVPEALWIGSYNAGVGNAMKGYTPLTYVARWKLARAAYQ